MPHKGSFMLRICIMLLKGPVLSIDIMRKIGELFLLRTNINSVGSVLDSPVSGPQKCGRQVVSDNPTACTGGFLGRSLPFRSIMLLFSHEFALLTDISRLATTL